MGDPLNRLSEGHCPSLRLCVGGGLGGLCTFAFIDSAIERAALFPDAAWYRPAS